MPDKISIDQILGGASKHSTYTDSEFNDIAIIKRSADRNPHSILGVMGSVVTRGELERLAREVDRDGDVTSFSKDEVESVIKNSIAFGKEKAACLSADLYQAIHSAATGGFMLFNTDVQASGSDAIVKAQDSKRKVEAEVKRLEAYLKLREGQ